MNILERVIFMFFLIFMLFIYPNYIKFSGCWLHYKLP